MASASDCHGAETLAYRTSTHVGAVGAILVALMVQGSRPSLASMGAVALEPRVPLRWEK